jgi:ribosomal-protein-alanine N-acetyltransferase
MRPRVVPAMKEDVAGIVTLHKSSLRHYKWAYDPHYIGWSVSHGQYYVMHYKGEIVGAIKVRLEHHYVWVCTIAVSKQYRGCGLGRRLIAFAKKYAQRSGYTRIKLDTLSVSRAEKFYAKLGFTMTYEGPFNGCKYRMYELNFKVCTHKRDMPARES